MSHVRSSILPQAVLISIETLSWSSVRLNKPKRSQMGSWIVWALKNSTSGRAGHEGEGIKGHSPLCLQQNTASAYPICTLGYQFIHLVMCLGKASARTWVLSGSMWWLYKSCLPHPWNCMRSTLAVTKAEKRFVINPKDKTSWETTPYLK